jgi:hypothetical protein
VPAAFGVDVGDTSGCQTLAGAEPSLLCPIDGGIVEYVQVRDALAEYRLVAGPDDGVAADGEPACADGRGEERAWATPDAPTAVAGRYLCRVVDGRAELWWTVYDDDVLAHASRRDGDLAALFTWWRAQESTRGHP